jgi:hypothetical protein
MRAARTAQTLTPTALTPDALAQLLSAAEGKVVTVDMVAGRCGTPVARSSLWR